MQRDAGIRVARVGTGHSRAHTPQEQSVAGIPNVYTHVGIGFMETRVGPPSSSPSFRISDRKSHTDKFHECYQSSRLPILRTDQPKKNIWTRKYPDSKVSALKHATWLIHMWRDSFIRNTTESCGCLYKPSIHPNHTHTHTHTHIHSESQKCLGAWKMLPDFQKQTHNTLFSHAQLLCMTWDYKKTHCKSAIIYARTYRPHTNKQTHHFSRTHLRTRSHRLDASNLLWGGYD